MAEIKDTHQEEREDFFVKLCTDIRDMLEEFERKYPHDENGIRTPNGYETLRMKIVDTNAKVTEIKTDMVRIMDPEEGVFPQILELVGRVKSLESFRKLFTWITGILSGAIATGIIGWLFRLF